MIRSLALRLSPLGFHSFTLQGNDLGCVDCWLALLSFPYGVENCLGL